MNFVPRPPHPPEPETEPGRPWVTSIAIGVMVVLCLGALVAHVLEGSNALQVIREFFAAKRAARAGIVEQYTRFRREDVEGGVVMTGFEFASSSDRAPTSQYCYFVSDKSGSGVKLHLALGVKITSVDRVFHPISMREAEQVGLSAERAANLARERCRFDQWE